MSLGDILGRLDDWMDRNRGRYARMRAPLKSGTDGTAPVLVLASELFRAFPGTRCGCVESIPDAVGLAFRNCPLAEYECGGRACMLGCAGDFSRVRWRWRERGLN